MIYFDYPYIIDGRMSNFLLVQLPYTFDPTREWLFDSASDNGWAENHKGHVPPRLADKHLSHCFGEYIGVRPSKPLCSDEVGQ